MSLFSALVSGVTGIRATAGSSVIPWGDPTWPGFWGGMGHSSAAGMKVTSETTKRLSTALACVQKKSTAIAMLPCKIYTEDGDGNKKVATNHPLYDVLYSRPNDLQTAFEFKQLMQAHVELRGNAYAEIKPGPRGAVDQLLPMHPDRVQVRQIRDTGRLLYDYSDPLTGEMRTLTQDEVFHLRENPDVIGVGQSRITMACDVIGLALVQQDYQARFLQNDATPGAFIVGTNFKTDEDEDEFVESLQRARTGKNRGRPYLLPAGVDMKSLSVDPVDQQLLEATKMSDVRICAIFNVLPHLIGVDAGKSSTFASTEQFNLMHVQQCLLPMAIMWEQAIQRCLITSDKYYAKFSMSALMRGDDVSQAELFHEALSDGWMCGDEVRELRDMNPIPDGTGKLFWNPLNWGRTDRPNEPPKAAIAAGSGASQPDDEEDDDAETDTSSDETDDEQASTARRQLLATVVQHGRTRPRATKGRAA